MAGAALVTAVGLATAASFAILLTALLYSPDINFQISAGETPTNTINPEDIGQRNFFGLAQAAPSIIVEDLPETKLELKLRGAFTAVDKANAGAIIEDDRKVAHHYAIGDEVPGDATLRAIYADRVVLARNGLLETLYFQMKSTRAASIRGATSTLRTAALTAQIPKRINNAETPFAIVFASYVDVNDQYELLTSSEASYVENTLIARCIAFLCSAFPGTN